MQMRAIQLGQDPPGGATEVINGIDRQITAQSQKKTAIPADKRRRGGIQVLTISLHPHLYSDSPRVRVPDLRYKASE